MLKSELKIFKSDAKDDRPTFLLNEMTPNEKQRSKIERSKAFDEMKTANQNEWQRMYGHQISAIDEICERLTKLGVTIFMPHVINPDLFSDVAYVAERKAQLTLVAKKMARLSPEHLKLINMDFDAFPGVLYDFMGGEEVLIMIWQTEDSEPAEGN